ncbi:polymorphic outer membrane protein repeat-containing protein [Parapedobacter koreensis]|uniref:Polymorphic outer membrane protein repeat-containing protein n=2 Tax=Parapedobacter koreensis TaxID=332977 RepID=A0A1H7TJP5_9SPHI|nr:polymorphic outer membrane protein repeat-containing protein [Parapedobacter koreensis]
MALHLSDGSRQAIKAGFSVLLRLLLSFAVYGVHARPSPTLHDVKGDGRSGNIDPDGNNILYVNRNASDSNGRGNSWGNAILELADALRWARERWGTAGAGAPWNETKPLQIWVAAGVYKPLYHAGDGQYTIDGGRDNAFVLVPYVKVYGGFPVDTVVADTGLESRDWNANRTILSGDFNNDDQYDEAVGWVVGGNEENAYHVVVSAGAVGTAVLDGFTVTGGNADGNGRTVLQVNRSHINRTQGGGIVNQDTAPILANLIINGNSTVGSGGGMDNCRSSPVLTNVTISGNLANHGGGMANAFHAAPILADVTIASNSAVNDGGGIYSTDTACPVLNGVIISNNLAGGCGGGMSIHTDAGPVLTDVSISGNVAEKGGGLFNASNASLRLTNVAIKDNSAANGGGIYVTDPSASMALAGVIIEGNSALNDDGDTAVIGNPDTAASSVHCRNR